MARRIGDRATIASTLSARYLTLWGPENADARLRDTLPRGIDTEPVGFQDQS